jgi:hypothetical protein
MTEHAYPKSSLGAPLVERLRATPEFLAMVPATQIVWGWVQSAQVLPAVACLDIASVAMSSEPVPLMRRGSVQIHIRTRDLALAHRIADQAEEIVASWSTDTMAYTATSKIRRDQGDSDFAQVVVRFAMTSEILE